MAERKKKKVQIKKKARRAKEEKVKVKTTQYQTRQEQGGRGGKQVQRRHKYEIVHDKNETRKTKSKVE